MMWRVELELLYNVFIDVEAETKEQVLESIKKELDDVDAYHITISYIGLLE